MIYSVKGEVTHIAQNLVVVECGGVGYACRTTSSAVAKAEMGQVLKLYTYLNIREDAAELYGFADESELNCFKMLISVSGVGCKVAVSILSNISPQEFALAVVNDDSKKITKVPGIGPKLASRIVLELKDKLKKDNSFTDTEMPKINLSAAGSNAFSEALTALMVLGFTNGQAQSALEGLSPDLTVQELIKEGLKRLSGR
ncbi:MAG: Holliday junction branch migration protein RuvA [Firmicutes bacterium]|nr:Holliday junction branch migration protein RuvA [[Eubacterium] siraeum]MCM1488095.1 Holliday junction branch migration protein RuvA [Bacillota bacterium]